MMALWEVEHFWSLVQIWGVMSDMTAEKVRDMLLEDERRKAEKKGERRRTRPHLRIAIPTTQAKKQAAVNTAANRDARKIHAGGRTRNPYQLGPN